MSIERASLKTHNTFALPVNAAHLVIADRIELMIKVWQKNAKASRAIVGAR